MRLFLIPVFLLVLILMANISFASAQEFHEGQSIILEAKKPNGVPLHREPAPSYLKHVPNNTTATIQRIDPDGQWLSIQLGSGEVHWVHKKYVQASTAAPDSHYSQHTFTTKGSWHLNDDEGRRTGRVVEQRALSGGYPKRGPYG